MGGAMVVFLSVWCYALFFYPHLSDQLANFWPTAILIIPIYEWYIVGNKTLILYVKLTSAPMLFEFWKYVLVLSSGQIAAPIYGQQ